MIERTYDDSDFAHPTSTCDIIMKGGITSGVVYPLAIVELAKRYRFGAGLADAEGFHSVLRIVESRVALPNRSSIAESLGNQLCIYSTTACGWIDDSRVHG
jgi:hypothetical protein